MKLTGLALNEVFSEDVYMKAKLNHADITRACEDAIKYSILEEKEITKDILLTVIQDEKISISIRRLKILSQRR